MSAHFRRLRAAIDDHGQGEGREAALNELDNLTHRVPLINQMATRNFSDVGPEFRSWWARERA